MAIELGVSCAAEQVLQFAHMPPSALILGAFLLFVLSGIGLAAGLLLRGKPITGSCGGVDPDGRPLADCLCERAREEAARTGRPEPSQPACEL